MSVRSADDSDGLRKWQKRAFNKYLSHSDPDFVTVATPGAGKTRFALKVASEMLRIGRVERVVVVCPTEHLKIQWAEAASRVGLHLDPRWENGSGAVAADYHGVCVTYAQVGTNREVHRMQCRVPTLAILDEVHHAGDGNTWGDAIRYAFEPAVRRLMMSGTLFRTDNLEMPFVKHDANGECIVHFTCSYSDALNEDACRPVLFPSYEGQMKWYARGNAFEASFRDEISERLAAQRLKTALDPKGDWMGQIVRDAHEKLVSVRETHRDAAGLIVAMDKVHASEIAILVKNVTGEMPALVTCDDPEASKAISEFSKSRRPWIVAIKMVSEGVDIPRLRVGVYATNITTEMYFRQFVGRFVRTIEGLDDQNAYVFIPRDDVIFGYAQRIAKERRHQLEEACKEALEREARDQAESPTDDKVLSLFLAVSSTGQADDVVFREDVIDQAEIREAEAIRQEIGASSSYDPAILARMFRKIKGTNVEVKAEARITEAAPTPKHEEKKALRKLVHRLVATIVEMTDKTVEYSDVFSALMKRDGVAQEQATVDQLKARISHLEQWAKELRNGR